MASDDGGSVTGRGGGVGAVFVTTVKGTLLRPSFRIDVIVGDSEGPGGYAGDPTPSGAPIPIGSVRFSWLSITPETKSRTVKPS